MRKYCNFGAKGKRKPSTCVASRHSSARMAPRWTWRAIDSARVYVHTRGGLAMVDVLVPMRSPFREQSPPRNCFNVPVSERDALNGSVPVHLPPSGWPTPTGHSDACEKRPDVKIVAQHANVINPRMGHFRPVNGFIWNPGPWTEPNNHVCHARRPANFPLVRYYRSVLFALQPR